MTSSNFCELIESNDFRNLWKSRLMVYYTMNLLIRLVMTWRWLFVPYPFCKTCLLLHILCLSLFWWKLDICCNFSISQYPSAIIDTHQYFHALLVFQYCSYHIKIWFSIILQVLKNFFIDFLKFCNISTTSSFSQKYLGAFAYSFLVSNWVKKCTEFSTVSRYDRVIWTYASRLPFSLEKWPND